MSIYKRGKSWYMDLVLGGHRIHRKVANTKTEAKALEEELKTRWRRGQLSVEDLRRERTFGSVAAEYLRHVKDTRSPRTYELERTDYEKHLSPMLANMIIQDIDNRTLTDFQAAQKRRKYANRTVNIHMGLVRKVMKFAEGHGYVGNVRLRYPMLQEPMRKHDFLSPAEFRALVKSFTFEGRMALLRVLFGRLTGLRPRELAYLAWTDVDLTLKLLRVQGKPSHGHTVKEDYERDVPLSLHAVSIIMRAKQLSKGPWVFSRGEKPVIDIGRAVSSAAQKAGIKKHVTPNMLRHTFATHFLMAGGDVAALQKLMGHKNLETTNRYVGAVDEHLRVSMDMLSNTYEEKPELPERPKKKVPTNSPHRKKKGPREKP